MLIRQLKSEDIPQLATLYKEFWNEDSNISRMEQVFNKLTNNEDYIILCAMEQNKLLGSVMGIVCQELYGDCNPFLVVENMIIDKSYRRNGIGKILFSELENIARGKNCTQVLLVTETNRVDACNFYESIGFSPDNNKGYKKKL